MRHIKKLLVLFLVFSGITSCEKEEVSYALQDISAPTDVNAIFDISQDEVGLVTLTPTGQGASSFEVYFGDVENESPTIVNPGETISHTYAEGEYNLRIVAVGLTGLTSELVRVVTVSFDPPTDLEVDIKISTTNPFELLVTPTATNATVYDVYFGDVEDEEPLTIMDTETASHVYTEVGDYIVRVVARGGGAATLEYTEEVTITGAVNAVTLPITFEDATVNYAASGFGAADFGPIPAEVIDNPDASGINTSAKVFSVNKLQDAQVWAGASIPLAGPIDFTNSTTVSIKVWSPRAGTPILFKIEDSSSPKDNNGNPTVFVEIQTSTTLVNTWEEITFDLSSIDSFDAANSYDTAIVFPDFGTAGKGELFYFDDIKLDGEGASEPVKLPITFDDATVNYTVNGFGAADFGPIPAEVINNPDASGINTTAKVLSVNKLQDAQVWAGASIPLAGPIDFSNSTTVSLKVWSPRAGTPILFKIEDSNSPKDNNGNPTVFVEIQTSSTMVNTWEEITFDLSSIASFDASNSYDTAIVFPDFGTAGKGELFYFDDIKLAADGGTGGGTNGGTNPTAAAPTPTNSAGNVKSIFSDVYSDPAGVNYYPDWGQSTAFEMIDISGNETIKYSNINYQGILTGEVVDASTFEFVHIDVWSADYTSLPFFLISGSGEKSVTLTLIPNQWNSIDIPLSDFTGQGLVISDLKEFKFDVQPNDGGTIFIDNLYFHKTGDGGDGGGTSGTAPHSPIDFETGGNGANWTWSVFENDTNPALEFVTNPGASGINTSSTVAKFTALQGGQPYAGVESEHGSDIGSFTFDESNKIVRIMVYKSVISDVGLKFSESNGEAQPEVKVANTKINEWEELTFDMSGSIGKGITGIIDQIIIFPDFQSRTSDNVVYFDNITFGSN
ncbi:hypothetical protein [Gillisia sp. CAL575]|uniref:hypothetical protein n=1 Tax=Gillisia sp. CAL575 TaxID=985255 RepID=UPI00055975F3|nr:hypothetical protein [Gillisia sp. CAL575]